MQNSLGRVKHLMSKVQRILAVRPMGFATTLAQMPGEIGSREGAVEIIDRHFCYVRRN